MSNKRAFESQEQAYFVSRLKTFGRGTLLLSATVLSFIAVLLMATDYLFQPQRFNIENVKIKGKFVHSSPQKIEAGLRDMSFGNFFALDLNHVKQRLEQLPWVARADIRREWPDTLAVQITEHRPAMRWQDNDEVHDSKGQLWLTTKAEVIEVPDDLKTDEAIDLQGNRYYAKSILEAAVRWRKSLAVHDLILLKVKQSETQAWSLALRSQQDDEMFEVLLGNTQVEDRLERFKYLFEEQFRFSDYRLERVDARYPNGLAVQHVNREVVTEDHSSSQG